MTNAPTTRETADHIGEANEKVTADHAELARLAEAATQGPWKACGTIYEHMNCEVRSGSKGEGQAIAQVWDGPNAFKDGQFIAATNPATVLSLLSEIAALRGRAEEADALASKHFVALREKHDDAAILKHGKMEAERQRDEAVGLLREWMGTWFVDADSRGEKVIADDTRKYLLANQGAE